MVIRGLGYDRWKATVLEELPAWLSWPFHNVKYRQFTGKPVSFNMLCGEECC